MVERKKPKIICGPSRTKQYDRAACNINNIVARVMKTGQMPVLQGGRYFDATRVPSDYHEAQNFIKKAEQKFWALNPTLRMRFNNDTGALLRFIEDPANAKECVELGLLAAPETPSAPPADKKASETEPKPA